METLCLAPVPPPAHLEFCVRPELLSDEDVDPEMRAVVAAINASGWVWTTWSCEGHQHEDGYTTPYLGLVTQCKNMGSLLEIFYQTARDVTIEYEPQGEGDPACARCIGFSLAPESVSKTHWCRFCIYPDIAPQKSRFDKVHFEPARAFFRQAALRIQQAR